MVKDTGCIKSRPSWHAWTVASRASACQDLSYLVMDVPMLAHRLTPLTRLSVPAGRCRPDSC
jgi:hypothetical protein